ncbi:unnamed protein product [Bathycoccus prasinos]
MGTYQDPLISNSPTLVHGPVSSSRRARMTTFGNTIRECDLLHFDFAPPRSALASLERELSLQISLENYTEAAKLRDSIALLKRDDLVAVETCNSLFYDAFRRGDFTLMHSKVWGSGAHVRCTHPGMPTVLGDENVKESWRIVFESMGGAGGSGSASSSTSQQKMDVKCKSVQAYANGNLGIVTCEEVVMRASTLTCTNVFEKQGGEWRMIQHHASAVFPGSVAAGGSSASSSS